MPINDHILRVKPAAQYCGFSVPTLYRLLKADPTFPNKVVLSARCVGFKKSSLDEWLKSREEAA